MGLIMVYATFKDLLQAREIVRALMEKRAIACANFFPIENWYWWQGKVEQGTEVVAVMKTREENWPKVQSEIKKLHSYNVPCIINMGTVTANKEYEEWVLAETRN